MFYSMELLAGEDRFEVEVKESGCVFKFDFSKVRKEEVHFSC